MFGDTVMTEPLEGVGKATMAGTHKAQKGLLGVRDAHTGSETLVGMLQAR
jgi:hypothetical protein